jgi:hypothetical protein
MAKKYDFGDGKVHGVDFEMIPSKGSKDSKGNPVLTRRFFTKAEKAAMKAPKAEAPKAKPAVKPKANVVSKEKPVTKGLGNFGVKGDQSVTTTKLDKKSSGRGDGGVEKVRRAADAALAKVKPVAKKETTFADWQKMSRAERKAKGLPTSEIGGQLTFKRFMTGITGKEYTK